MLGRHPGHPAGQGRLHYPGEMLPSLTGPKAAPRMLKQGPVTTCGRQHLTFKDQLAFPSSLRHVQGHMLDGLESSKCPDPPPRQPTRQQVR